MDVHEDWGIVFFNNNNHGPLHNNQVVYCCCNLQPLDCRNSKGELLLLLLHIELWVVLGVP